MRKYLIGFIAGLLVASALPTYAAVSTMIGKTVQAENAVVVNGKELEVKAVNIEGTTFTPNRALAEALGLDIKFENGTVIIEQSEVSNVNEPQIDDSQITDETSSAEPNEPTELERINARISELSKYEQDYLVTRNQLVVESLNNPDRKAEIEQHLEQLRNEIRPLIEELRQLEKRREEIILQRILQQ